MPKPVLLLLPGMLCDRASWGAVPDALSDIADIRVIDYGSADTIGAMADAALAQAPERFAVAGHSMGGRVAQTVQKRASARVSGLGLFGTSCEAPANAEALAAERAVRQEQIDLARRLGLRGFAETAWLARMIHPTRRADAALVEAFLEMMDRQTLETMQSHINAGLTRADTTAWLSEIACPTLVLAGDSDAGRPAPIHRAMAARIPGATLVLVPQSGHMVMMEQPAAVATAMRGWLERIAHAPQ